MKLQQVGVVDIFCIKILKSDDCQQAENAPEILEMNLTEYGIKLLPVEYHHDITNRF